MGRRYKGILYYSNKRVCFDFSSGSKILWHYFCVFLPITPKDKLREPKAKTTSGTWTGVRVTPMYPDMIPMLLFAPIYCFLSSVFLSCAYKLDLAFPLFFFHWYPSWIVVWSKLPFFGWFLLSWPLSVLCYKTPLGEWESSLLFLVCLCMSVLVGYMTLDLVHVFST